MGIRTENDVKKQEAKSYIKIIVESILMIICGLVLWSLCLSLLRVMGINIASDSTVGNVLLELVFLLVPFLVIWKHYKINLAHYLDVEYNHKYSIKELCAGIVIGMSSIIMIYVILFVMHIISYAGSGFAFYQPKEVIEFVIKMFVRALFAGVCEEVYFRGLLQNYFTKLTNGMVGLMVASVIFAFLHCSRYSDLLQLSTVLLGGIALGFIYQKTESLYLPIGLHIATDFFINLVAPQGQISLFICNINFGYNEESLMQMIFALSSVFYVMIIVFFFVRYKRKILK